jgi:thioredoxin-related protein
MMNPMPQERLSHRRMAGGWMFAAFLLALFSFTPALANPPAGPWSTDLAKAMQTAKQAGKPVLVMFSAEWCPPCNTMKKNVFTRPEVQDALKTWVPVYVDEAAAPELLERFKIEGFPTFAMLNSQGEELDRFIGGRPAKEFIGRIGDALKINNEAESLNKDLAKSPLDPKLWKRRGDLFLTQGLADKSIESYKKAQKLDPQNHTGVAADIYFVEALKTGDKDPKAADAKLAGIGALYPGSPRVGDALFMRAQLAMKDRPEAAASLLQKYLSQYPKGKFVEPAKNILEDLKQHAAGEQSPSGTDAAPKPVPPVPKP